MNVGARMTMRMLVLTSLIATMMAIGEAQSGTPTGLVGKWLGQDGHDYVGGEPGPSKNDYQDIHITIKGLPPNRELAEVEILGFGGGGWNSSQRGTAAIYIVRPPRSTSADLYVEPEHREVGREFEIKLTLDDGQKASITIQGGKADPNLRAPGAGVEAKWLGQDGQDRTGADPRLALTDSRTSTCPCPSFRARPRSSPSRSSPRAARPGDRAVTLRASPPPSWSGRSIGPRPTCFSAPAATSPASL